MGSKPHNLELIVLLKLRSKLGFCSAEEIGWRGQDNPAPQIWIRILPSSSPSALKYPYGAYHPGKEDSGSSIRDAYINLRSEWSHPSEQQMEKAKQKLERILRIARSDLGSRGNSGKSPIMGRRSTKQGSAWRDFLRGWG